MDKEEKRRRASLCQKCYTCQQGVSSDKTVDDMKDGRLSLSEEKKAELCKNCYTCQQGVSSAITVDQLKAKKGSVLEDRASLCRNCYTCQQGVSSDVTVDSMKGKQLSLSESEKAKLCRNCYTCQQGVSPGVSVEQMKPGGVSMPFVYYLFPAGVSCNFRCKYPCYAGEKKGKMSRATMHQVLKWLFEKQSHKNLTCHFFGGEPTLEWNLLVDIVELGSEMAKKNGYRVTWSMTTNGSLLTEERLQWIKEHFRPGNPFLLSIDGRPETHNKYRVFAGGKPTFESIPVDRILELFPNIECRPTIMPDTAKGWFEDYRYLRNRGFKAIAIEPNYETEWSEEQMDDYEKMLRQLGDYYIHSIKAGSPIRMKFIDQVLSGLRNTKPPTGRMCGVAFNSAGIDHRGKLYACQRYASYNEPDKYALGDVWHGWDEYSLWKTQALFREEVHGDLSKGYNCSTCEIRQYCYKGCNSANSKLMGTREISLPNYCRLSKVEVRAALWTLSALGLLKLRES